MKPKHSRSSAAGSRSTSWSRTVGAALIVAGGTAGLAVTQTMSTAYSLTATTALITAYEGGLGPNQLTSAVKRYMNMAMDNYVIPGLATPSDGTYNSVAVVNVVRNKTESLDKVTAANQVNLDDCIQATNCNYNQHVGSAAPSSDDSFVVFGYSESTGWATLEKRALAAEYPTAGTGPQVSFVLIGNLSRPNGGVSERNPLGTLVSLLDLRANGSTPTDTQYTTIDITRQYDGASDAPLNPNNFLANLNAKMGFVLVHTVYDKVGLQPGGGALEQDQYGDTTYYMIPTPTLPLLMPLLALPGGKILADALDPELRVIVESAYDRTVSPGVPTPHDPTYAPDPTAYAADLALAKLTGRDNFCEDLGLGRPNGTTRPDTSGQGAYGIGGPPVTMAQQTDPTTSTTPITTMTTAAAVTTTTKPLTNIVRNGVNASPTSGTTTTAHGSRPLATAAEHLRARVRKIATAIRTSVGAKSAAAKAHTASAG